MNVDNMASINIAKHKGFSPLTKNIDTKYYYVSDCFQRQVIELQHIKP